MNNQKEFTIKDIPSAESLRERTNKVIEEEALNHLEEIVKEINACAYAPIFGINHSIDTIPEIVVSKIIYILQKSGLEVSKVGKFLKISWDSPPPIPSGGLLE